MMFAALLRGSRGIEIAKARVLKSRISLVIGQNSLENQLGFSIRIDRSFAMILGDGHGFGLAISRRGGRKNKSSHAVARHGIQQIYSASDIRRVKDARLFDRLGYQRFGCKMHNRVNLS